MRAVARIAAYGRDDPLWRVRARPCASAVVILRAPAWRTGCFPWPGGPEGGRPASRQAAPDVTSITGGGGQGLTPSQSRTSTVTSTASQPARCSTAYWRRLGRLRSEEHTSELQS